MIELRPLKTMLALAAALTASAALGQPPPASITAPDSPATTQAVSSDPGSITSSTDPLVQKRIDDKVRSAEYEMDKTRAKPDYKNQMPTPWPLHPLPWLH
ncbi:hypothetical protein [Ralstonia sp. 24A2]|uniref:hypothetical protein n=1 Tax=Ralstonia sp. 24A2 TaxID=3447364 RepID=UPI003F695776